MMERRRALSGPLPHRVVRRPAAARCRRPDVFDEFDAGSGKQAVSTTMAFAVLLRNLLRDKEIGQRVVPIIPDEARTFGLDALFSEVKIYAPLGQLYEPVDSKLMLSYREAKEGQILEEGITEAGGDGRLHRGRDGLRDPWPAHDPVLHLLFDVRLPAGRRPDLGVRRHAGAAGSCSAAPPGAPRCSARACSTTTATPWSWPRRSPTCRPTTPRSPTRPRPSSRTASGGCTGRSPEDIFYYLTLYNENYVMPAMPDEPGVERGDRRGASTASPRARRARPGGRRSCSRGTACRARPRGPAAPGRRPRRRPPSCGRATSYKALREEALSVERHNRLHPEPSRRSRPT